MGFKDWFKSTKNAILVGCSKAADAFCDMVDYFRYDQGLIASTARAFDNGLSALLSIPGYLASSLIKGTYHGVGALFGVTEEEMDKPFIIAGNYINNKIEQGMNYLAKKGVNIRFISDLASCGLHILEYIQIGKLSRNGLRKIQGIFNESARRYKINKLNFAKQMRDLRNENMDNYLKKCHEKNIELYNQNQQAVKAVKKAIEEDYQQQRKQIKNIIPIKDPKFREGILTTIINALKDGLIDYLKYLKGLGLNTAWLLKENFMNFLNNLFGKMGGFHTCPYGCGRPIPNAFKGCTELLEAFPDYFNK
jgi:hypothetical protein